MNDQSRNEEQQNTGKKYEYDKQTGRSYELVPEDSFACFLATVGLLYLPVASLMLLLYLADVWTGGLPWWWWPSVRHLGNKTVSSALFHVMAYAMIGGGLGGILDEARSLFRWHCELGAYGSRFFPKTLLAPWLGVILSLLVVAALKTGLLMLGDGSTTASTQSALAMFAIGGLIGYGSHDVLRWLDVRVARRFAVDTSLVTPKLIGLTLKQAKSSLEKSGLSVGTITPSARESDKIESQSPGPGEAIPSGGTVNLVIQSASAAPEGHQKGAAAK